MYLQFDTLKTRLQTCPKGYYSGLFDCLRKTAKREGLRGFYAGIGSPLIGQMFFRAASFTTFFYTINLLGNHGNSLGLSPSSSSSSRNRYFPGSSSEYEYESAPSSSSSSVQQVSNTHSDGTGTARIDAAHYMLAGAITGLVISIIEVRGATAT
jgi:Mitochondrial carrier protein